MSTSVLSVLLMRDNFNNVITNSIVCHHYEIYSSQRQLIQLKYVLVGSILSYPDKSPETLRRPSVSGLIV